MINKEQIAAFRELLERFGECTFKDEALPEVIESLFLVDGNEVVYTGATSMWRMCEALTLMRILVVRDECRTIDAISDHIENCSSCGQAPDMIKNCKEDILRDRNYERMQKQFATTNHKINDPCRNN